MNRNSNSAVNGGDPDRIAASKFAAAEILGADPQVVGSRRTRRVKPEPPDGEDARRGPTGRYVIMIRAT
jgi:hypothetical protein